MAAELASVSEIAEIRRQSAAGVSTRDIARALDIDHGIVFEVLHGVPCEVYGDLKLDSYSGRFHTGRNS